MERPTLLYKYICNICDDLHVWQRHKIRCKRLWKNIKTQSKLCPGGALSMNGGRTRGVPEATWVGQRLPPEICLFLYLPDIPQLFVCRHMHNSVLTKRCKPIYITQKITMCRNTQWVFKLTHRASKYLLSVLLQAECVITRFDIDKLTLSAWFILLVANFFYMLWCMWQISGMVRTTQLSCPNFE